MFNRFSFFFENLELITIKPWLKVSPLVFHRVSQLAAINLVIAVKAV